jgi:hypothetical protein
MSKRLSPAELGFAAIIIMSGLIGGLIIGVGPALGGDESLPESQSSDPTGAQVQGDGSGAPVSAAQADHAYRLGTDAAEISVVAADAVDWSDGSVGCPEPGRAYPQVITPGYRIILDAGGTTYEYHASRTRPPFYCENPRPPVGGSLAPTTLNPSFAPE